MNEIDGYELWYEYLKRSRRYRRYCRAMRGFSSSKSKIKPQLDLFDTYSVWGDIFPDSFKVSYQRFKKNQNQNNEKPVQKLGEIFKKSAIDLIRVHKKKHGKEITLKEFVEFFENRFQQGAIYLKIDVTKGPEQDILNDVKKIVRQRKKEEGVKNIITLKNRNLRIWKKSLRVADLKKYLEVYDLKSKKKNTEAVVLSIGTPADKKALHRDNERRDDVLRKYKLYYANAKRIIKNVENGDFPGAY